MSNEEYQKWRDSRTKQILDAIFTALLFGCGAITMTIFFGLEFWV